MVCGTANEYCWKNISGKLQIEIETVESVIVWLKKKRNSEKWKIKMRND